jgi:broad specificity phosphatase PhoE/8-oxo-dGTP pyrophosphatase MutT (NUDIX family)
VDAKLSDHVIRAAGGVVWRATSDGHPDEAPIEVAIIHRPRYDDWSIPKGKLARGETEVEGAVREVVEETGYRVRLGRPLGEVRYMKTAGGVSRPKVVRYWAMQADGGTFAPTREVDELRWLSLAEAKELLTHEHDKELLERFARGPTFIGSVLLVRHGSAGSRSTWEGDDRARPLDDLGWEQADELVRLLARFEVEEIVSADYARCVQTVQPFAEAVGLPVREEPLFSEEGYPSSDAQALKLLRSYAESGSATVVCSQGDVIPDVLQRLAAEDHVDLPDPLPNKKGSVWALSFDGDRLFSAEYFPPPQIDN